MIKKLIKKLKKLVKKIHKLTRPRKKIGRPLGVKDKVKRKSPRKMDLTGLDLSLRCMGPRPIIYAAPYINEESLAFGESTQKETKAWVY